MAEAGACRLTTCTERAVEGITYEGKYYGVPFDFHAYLWHVNMDLMAEAGLVNEDGTPKLPSSPEEMLEHARQVKEATGADYLTSFFTEGPQNLRLFAALMAQQGVDPYNEDGVNIDSEAGRNAINAFAALDEEGLIDVTVPEELGPQALVLRQRRDSHRRHLAGRCE